MLEVSTKTEFEEVLQKEVLIEDKIEIKRITNYTNLQVDDIFYSKYGCLPHVKHFLPCSKKIESNLLSNMRIIQKIEYSNKDGVIIAEYENAIFSIENTNLSLNISVYYKKINNNLQDIFDLIKKSSVKISNKNKIYFIQEDNGLNLVSCNLPKLKMDFNLNYGKDFGNKNTELLKILNKDGSGLVLLHSVPGMGKTSYIQYLCSKLKKMVIFIPISLSLNLTSPALFSFIRRHCSNSILIIEDAELLLKSREDQENSFISDLLNITDGLVGKALNIKIIATYNTNRANIDEALLRKGRLLFEHEFKKISIENSQKLIKNLHNEDVIVNNELTLAEIYNYKQENYSQVKRPRKKVGF